MLTKRGIDEIHAFHTKLDPLKVSLAASFFEFNPGGIKFKKGCRPTYVGVCQKWCQNCEFCGDKCIFQYNSVKTHALQT